MAANARPEAGRPRPARAPIYPIRIKLFARAPSILEQATRGRALEIRCNTARTSGMTCMSTVGTADPALLDLRHVEMPDEDAESGRGLAIALATLDELTHERDGGNTWRLRRLHRGA